MWLQKDDCPNDPNLVHLELDDAGRLMLSRGWRTFGNAQRLMTDQVLLFRYNGVSTLFVTAFECLGGRVECCTEGGSEEDGSSGDEEEEDEENLPHVKEEDRDWFPG